jgi:3'-phosphoadenosine 5'-phosphosulfate sulfotransferase (PAPS reductase)/FAD synthetase
MFSDTGHEAPEVSTYIDMLEREHGLVIERVQPLIEDMRGELVRAKIADRLGLPDDDDVWSHPLTMETLSVLKRRFPSAMVRFCTTYLKLRPQARVMGDWDMSGVVRVAGVRAQESAARAMRPDWVDHDDVFGCPLWLPIHSWTHDEVFQKHAEHGIPPNPLYLQGMARVGCWPCIMARKSELRSMAENRPDAFVSLAEMEDRVAASVGVPAISFFSNYTTPRRYHSQVCGNTGESFPVAEDIRLWALGSEPADSGQSLLFEDDWTEDNDTCSSQYGLCE